MIKDKQWALNRIDGHLECEKDYEAKIVLSYAKSIINQIDESELEEIKRLKKDIETQRKTIVKIREESVNNYHEGYEQALADAVDKGELGYYGAKYKLFDKKQEWVVNKPSHHDDYFSKFLPTESKPFFWQGEIHKENALRFANKELAEGVAKIIGGHVESYE